MHVLCVLLVFHRLKLGVVFLLSSLNIQRRNRCSQKWVEFLFRPFMGSDGFLIICCLLMVNWHNDSERRVTTVSSFPGTANQGAVHNGSTDMRPDCVGNSCELVSADHCDSQHCHCESQRHETKRHVFAPVLHSFFTNVPCLLQAEQKHEGADCNHQLTPHTQHLRGIREPASSDRIPSTTLGTTLGMRRIFQPTSRGVVPQHACTLV